MTTLGLFWPFMYHIKYTIQTRPPIFLKSTTRAPNIRPIEGVRNNTAEAGSKSIYLLLPIRHNVNLDTTINTLNSSISLDIQISGVVKAKLVCLSFEVKVGATAATCDSGSGVLSIVHDVWIVTLVCKTYTLEFRSATSTNIAKLDSESARQSGRSCRG